MRRTLPEASVVIPVFNGSAYVERTIRSALAQTVADVEVIVVDDGSTDGSPELVDALVREDARASLHRFENAGAAVARNRGLAVARAPFVAFLDHDDIWYPQKLERQLLAFRRNPNAAVVGCLMRYIGSTGRELGFSAHVPDPIDQEAVRTGRLTPFPTCSSALFRIDRVRDVGGFADLFGRGETLAEDLYLYARLARLGEVVCVREVLGAYRVHSAAARSEASELFGPAVAYVQSLLADPSLRERVDWNTFRASHQLSRRERRKQLGQASYRSGAVAVLDGKWGAAAHNIGRALVLAPRFTITRAFRQLRAGRHVRMPS